MAENRLGEPGDIYRPQAPAAGMSYPDRDRALRMDRHRTLPPEDHSAQAAERSSAGYTFTE